MDISQLIDMIDPDVYENLKNAVALGKWADGKKLTSEQKELSLQAIIAYDIAHKPENSRVGSISSPTTCSSFNGTNEPGPELIKLPTD